MAVLEQTITTGPPQGELRASAWKMRERGHSKCLGRTRRCSRLATRRRLPLTLRLPPREPAVEPGRSAAKGLPIDQAEWWFVSRVGDTCEVQFLDRHGAAAALARLAPGATAVVVGER